MLITKELKVKWNPTTRKYYENLGHEYTKHNDEFLIPIEDLHHGSNTYIDFQCDECDKIENRVYRDYIILKTKYNKDICGKCLNRLNMKNRSLKAKTKEDFGYYTTHDNRRISLDEYLNKYNTLHNMTHNNEGKKLYDIFHYHKDSIYDTAKELGYKIEDICANLPLNYYDDNNEMYKEKLLKFIDEYGRFPLHIEIEKDLRINSARIQELGGINYFRKLINYTDDKIIDKNGDYNMSIREQIVADHLYDMGFKNKYLREKRPFLKDEGYYRSDFTFYPIDNKEIHIEVWGYPENKNDKQGKQYNKVRNDKINLYNKHEDDIELISLNDNIFRNKSIKNVTRILNIIFDRFKNIDFKDVRF